MDRNYKRVTKQAGIIIDIKRGDDMRHFPIELARIESITATIYPGIATILGYGLGPGPRSLRRRPHSLFCSSSWASSWQSPSAV